VKFDTSKLDQSGFQDGQHIAYQYCIPSSDPTYVDIVRHVDATASCEANNTGKIGCNVETELLCTGDTRQSSWVWKIALMKFSSLDFIKSIEKL